MISKVILLAASLLLAADGQPPKLENPKYYTEYGKETTITLLTACVSSFADNHGFTRESSIKFCACHVWHLEDTIPLKTMEAMSDEQKVVAFKEIIGVCVKQGLAPVKANTGIVDISLP